MNICKSIRKNIFLQDGRCQEAGQYDNMPKTPILVTLVVVDIDVTIVVAAVVAVAAAVAVASVVLAVADCSDMTYTHKIDMPFASIFTRILYSKDLSNRGRH